MIPWRGHLSFRVYSPDKPVKYGIRACWKEGCRGDWVSAPILVNVRLRYKFHCKYKGKIPFYFVFENRDDFFYPENWSEGRKDPLNGLIEHVQFCENTGIKVQVANNTSISDYCVRNYFIQILIVSSGHNWLWTEETPFFSKPWHIEYD
jgi:hypothetical protein